MRVGRTSKSLIKTVAYNSQLRLPLSDLDPDLDDDFVTESYKELLRDLNNADFVCGHCGATYGTSNCFPLYATYHTGYCDVCQAPDATVTSVRSFGYLTSGILAVEKVLGEHVKNVANRKNSSKRKTDRSRHVQKFMDGCGKLGV